jgi:hypothetical protein
VKALRAAPDIHWASVWGIVDRDQRGEAEVVDLRGSGIWSLSHYSVESYYYHPKIIARIAARQAEVFGGDAGAKTAEAIADAIEAVRQQRAHLIGGTVLRQARMRIMERLPVKADVAANAPLTVAIDIPALKAAEEQRFDALVAANDWDGLLARYPVRESGALGRIVSAIGVPSTGDYRGAVLKLLQDDGAALAEVRELLGELRDSVNANPA